MFYSWMTRGSCVTRAIQALWMKRKSKRCWLRPRIDGDFFGLISVWDLAFQGLLPLPILRVMAVQNRIVKVQKRNRALVKFDPARIQRAILRAAESIGGFKEDFLPRINDKLFEAWHSDDKLAQFLADAVVVCLNSDPHHLIANFPPTIETIQDEVLHALRSYGFQNTADAYECYRWGRHWLREGAINGENFVGNGFPRATMAKTIAWNHIRGCDTVTRLNEMVRAGKLKALVAESLAVYEKALD